MNGGYPTAGAAGAASYGSLSGSGSAAAFVQGARAAAMLARFSGALGLAILLYELIRMYRQGAAQHTGFSQAYPPCANNYPIGVSGNGTTIPCFTAPIGPIPDNATGYNLGMQYPGVPGVMVVQETYSRNPGYTGKPFPTASQPPLFIPGALPNSLADQDRRPLFGYWPMVGTYSPPKPAKRYFRGLGLAWAPFAMAPHSETSSRGYYPPLGGIGGLFPGAGVRDDPRAPPGVIPIPGVGVIPRPGVLPIPGAGSLVPVIPGAGVVIPVPVAPTRPFPPAVVPVPMFPARPRRGTRDIKGEVSEGMKGFNALYGPVTELSDIWGALHKALPECRRTKSQKMLNQGRAARAAGGWNSKYRAADIPDYQKVNDIARFLNDLAGNPRMASRDVCRGIGAGRAGNVWTDGRPDPRRGAGEFASDSAGFEHAASQFAERALRELVRNEISDRLYGRLGKEIGKVNRATGLPIGLQTIRHVSQFKL